MYAMLVAHDDDELAILSLTLQRAGMAIATTRSLRRALDGWAERPADVLVVALPNQEPLQVVHRVRQETAVPLVIIADYRNEEEHATLLKQGADLVLHRPYSARLLIAQVQSLLRRAGGVPYLTLPTLTVGDLTLDPGTRTVQTAESEPQRLTHLEFRLLYTLMLHRGQIMPTETIVERVWGYSGEGDRGLVRGLVSRLRSKVEKDPRRPRYIQTVAGLGYAFRSE